MLRSLKSSHSFLFHGLEVCYKRGQRFVAFEPSDFDEKQAIKSTAIDRTKPDFDQKKMELPTAKENYTDLCASRFNLIDRTKPSFDRKVIPISTAHKKNTDFYTKFVTTDQTKLDLITKKWAFSTQKTRAIPYSHSSTNTLVYQLLFQATRGDILLVATAHGKEAAKIKYIGGVLTQAFLNSIPMLSYNNKQDQDELWAQLLEKTKDQVSAIGYLYLKKKETPIPELQTNNMITVDVTCSNSRVKSTKLYY